MKKNKPKCRCVDHKTGKVIEEANTIGELFLKMFNVDCFIDKKKGKSKNATNTISK